MEDSADIDNSSDKELSTNSPRTVKMAAGFSNARTSGISEDSSRNTGNGKAKKPRKPSKTATLQAEMEERMNNMEDNFNCKLDKIMEVLVMQGQNRVQLRSDNATGNSVGNGPPGTRRPQNSEDNVPEIGERRPILSLEPNLDQELGSPRVSRNRDFDIRSEISLHVGNEERVDFESEIRSDPESDSEHSQSNEQIHVNVTQPKSARFVKHVVTDDNNEKAPNDNNEGSKKVNVLGRVFKDDCNKQKSVGGLILDQAQTDILDLSWRSHYPDRITAYKDEYKSCFPIHDDSVEYLKVPVLDDIFELMLKQTHGTKAVKSWDSVRQLHTQPFKQIERLGFQGQLSARMNIISMLYIQQALGNLAQSVENGDITPESLSESIRDIFAMSTKSLDQAGRSGAFFHLIRRKVVAHDSGLSNLVDMRSKCQYFPLTSEGVFGNALESSLEKRKEQKEQLSELLPEFNPQKKRKWNDGNESANKVAKTSSYQGYKGAANKSKTSNANTNNYSSGFSKNRKSDVMQNREKPAVPNKPTESHDYRNGKKTGTKSSWGSFRIPKKNDS